MRRPRFIVWTGAGFLMVAATVIVALGVTSTKWFCAEVCHKVQGDTIIAYERSTHSNVSCMACHMPVGADPVTFLFHKAEALGELYLTVTGDFALPLNPESHIALEMPERQCTQCHNLDTRPPTPSRGVLIDHGVHSREGFGCTVCHNRVAHNEDFKLTLKDPKTGKPNQKHEQFMSMTACFRCHEQTQGAKATGACEACHTPGFELKPPSHRVEGFYPKGHADLAQLEASRTAVAARKTGASETETGHASEERPAEEGGHGGDALVLPKVSSINECSTCHAERFCTDCHGLPMPHPGDFKTGHGKAGKKNPQSCALCHGDPEVFCDECHHGTSMGVPYDASQAPWQQFHPEVVRALGANRCFECHDPTFCALCHVRVIRE